MPDQPESSDGADQDRWIQLDIHATAMLRIIRALAESAADRTGQNAPHLVALFDDVEEIWRTVRSRLFPD